jgi:hypothetical protein
MANKIVFAVILAHGVCALSLDADERITYGIVLFVYYFAQNTYTLLCKAVGATKYR